MGHLVNPIAFRLGHSRSWEDTWYIKNIYYPEFLHSMIRIRQYLYYFWTTKYMEKRGFLLSHLYFYKFIKNLLIKIFLYNIDLEKNIYEFYARGTGIFSDSFYLRFKWKKKKKEPFSYERYKPDLFYSLFLYYSFFSYNKKKYFIKYKKKKKNKNLKLYNLSIKKSKNLLFLNKIKNGDLHYFLKLPKTIKKKNENLKIARYEDKIKVFNINKLNMGFLDFLIYIFFKINMLEKDEENKLKKKMKRKHIEMVLNYPLKIQRWIDLLNKYIITKVKLKIKKKKSIKNFIFFLVIMLEFIMKWRKKFTKIKLRDLNLKLVRILFLNKILTNFAYFYGVFLRQITLLLSNIEKVDFKFCFISNNSVNARFLARYIGLKLRKKFPLFSVINPLKKELKKLAYKKRENRSHLLHNYYDYKLKKKQIHKDYKESFKNVVLYFYNKFIELNYIYYKQNLTFITFDYLIYYKIVKKNFINKFNYKNFKKKFLIHYKEKIWKKKSIIINYKWILFILLNFKNIIKKIWWKKKGLNRLNSYIKNKGLINLLFGVNKYNMDSLAIILFILKFDINTFFFVNKNYVSLLMYNFFNNYIFLNINTLFNIQSKYLIISNYFLKTYIKYLYISYSYYQFINAFNVNKRKIFLKIKELHKINSYILGYKMSFKGRFTRKQRASSIWFHQGVVPLNTVKGHIDFAFFTIPLKNSSVSIKLWLYKNTGKMLWHNKFIDKNKENETTT
jgi:hypothetical protein